MRTKSLWWGIVGFGSILPYARAFSFTDTPGTECDNLAISWTGGSSPFQLVIIPIFGTPRNVSIPATAFSGGKGTFSVPLPIPRGHQYILTMSDATGFGSGGFTDLRTVGASLGGSCNSTDPGVDFSFELNTALQQCRPYTFSGYSGAVLPVTIIAIVPGGQAVTIGPATSPSFDWTASVTSGTSMVFMMTDSTGRQGGCSDVKTVGASNDATCLNANSPSTTVRPSSTVSKSPKPTSSKTTSPSPTTTTAPGGISVGAIAGTVIGGLVFLAVAITLGLFFLRRGRKSWDGRRHSQRIHSAVNLVDSDPTSHPYGSVGGNVSSASPFLPPGGQYEPTPYTHPPPQLPSASRSDLHSPGYPLSGGYNQSTYGSGYTATSYDSSTPGYGRPTPAEYGQPPQMFGHPPQGYTLELSPAGYSHRPMPSASDMASTGIASDQSSGSNRDTIMSSQMSASQRKAAMAGESSYKPQPSRFILHTDAEDALPPPNEDGVVELPPQYSERRAPLVNLNPEPVESSQLAYMSPPPGGYNPTP